MANSHFLYPQGSEEVSRAKLARCVAFTNIDCGLWKNVSNVNNLMTDDPRPW